ncbi:hypothetical protein F4778DRAFT_776694 [Xylariomycetidae sp. FL2044]|nr:hypothetical protein F4778DRAFT_776694 [Xylariomycetidae sp. FL2044]
MHFSLTLIALVSQLLLQPAHGVSKTVNYDCTKVPQICLNTCWAQQCAGHSRDLHGGASNTGDTRAEWGYNSGICKSQGYDWQTIKTPTHPSEYADSPDEYPLASSAEGGWRTADGKVVSLRCVPQGEQSSQGGSTTGIGVSSASDVWTFTWHNIQDLEKTTGKYNYCEKNPTCKNDGHQWVPTASGGYTLDDPDGYVKRGENQTEASRRMVWSDDGNTATLRMREEGDELVPIPFEA